MKAAKAAAKNRKTLCRPQAGNERSLRCQPGKNRRGAPDGTPRLHCSIKLNRRTYLSSANDTRSIDPASTSATLFSSGKAARLMKSAKAEALH